MTYLLRHGGDVHAKSLCSFLQDLDLRTIQDANYYWGNIQLKARLC